MGNFTPRQKEAYDEIMSRMPGLMYEKYKLDQVYIRPTAVVIPARLYKPFEGEEAEGAATGHGAMLMNLPVVWSAEERWGLLIELPKEKNGD